MFAHVTYTVGDYMISDIRCGGGIYTTLIRAYTLISCPTSRKFFHFREVIFQLKEKKTAAVGSLNFLGKVTLSYKCRTSPKSIRHFVHYNPTNARLLRSPEVLTSEKSRICSKELPRLPGLRRSPAFVSYVNVFFGYNLGSLLRSIYCRTTLV